MTYITTKDTSHLATWVDDKTVDVTIVNGRQARAIKRQRNKAVCQLQRKISKCKMDPANTGA